MTDDLAKEADDRGAARAQLIDRYRLETSGEGVDMQYIGFKDGGGGEGGEPRQWAAELIGDTLKCIGEALTKYGGPHYYFSDDDVDYLNALTDQLMRCNALRSADDPAEMLEGLFETLNYRELDDSEGVAADYEHMGFIWGYADHYTPISALMIANDYDLIDSAS